jgi:hypothetical protein
MLGMIVVMKLIDESVTLKYSIKMMTIEFGITRIVNVN